MPPPYRGWVENLLLRDDGEEGQLVGAVVFHRMGAALGAIVALSGGQRFGLAVAGDACRARENVNDLGGGLMRVHSDGRAGDQSAAHDGVLPVGKASRGVFLFAAFEIGEDGFVHFGKINQHFEGLLIKISCVFSPHQACSCNQ